LIYSSVSSSNNIPSGYRKP